TACSELYDIRLHGRTISGALWSRGQSVDRSRGLSRGESLSRAGAHAVQRAAAARAEAVVEVLGRVGGDARATTLARGASVEAAHEGAVRHPLVQVPDHVEHGVVAPLTAAARRLPGAAEQRALAVRDEVEPRVEVLAARVAVEHGGRVRRTKDVAAARD